MSRAKITDANGFSPMRALVKVAADPRIDEIEGAGMDDGRVFLHLCDEYWFEGYDCGSKSVGDEDDIRYAMSLVRRRPKRGI